MPCWRVSQRISVWIQLQWSAWWKSTLMSDHPSFKVTFCQIFPFLFPWEWTPDLGPPLFLNHFSLCFRVDLKEGFHSSSIFPSLPKRTTFRFNSSSLTAGVCRLWHVLPDKPSHEHPDHHDWPQPWIAHLQPSVHCPSAGPSVFARRCAGHHHCYRPRRGEFWCSILCTCRERGNESKWTLPWLWSGGEQILPWAAPACMFVQCVFSSLRPG